MALNRAVAVAEVDGPRTALELIDGLAARRSTTSTTRSGPTFSDASAAHEAAAAYQAAIDRTDNAAEIRFLEGRIAAMRAPARAPHADRVTVVGHAPFPSLSASRTNGLVYARDSEDYLVVASNGGADRPPAWLHNVRAEPDVEIQVGREHRPATARIIESSDPSYERLWKLVNEHNRDRYTAYQQKTTRPIPVIAITPH